MLPSPSLSAREVALALAGGLLLAAAMFWPLPLHLGRDIPRDLGDPLLQAWQVAWGGHALTTQPLDYFQSNTFWPLDNSLAFSDALVGYSPAGLLGDGSHAAVVRYDLLFLFAYGLAFAGAYLLARELGLPPAAAVIAGAAFAYAPWRLEQNGHLHVISSGGIPLAFFLLLRGYRRTRPALVVGGFAAAAWQVSLGFSLGLPLLYLLLLGLLAGAGLWLWRHRPPLDRSLVKATLAGGLLLTAAAVALALPYLEVLDDHPEAKRTIQDVEIYSPPIRGFAAAPPENLIWGEVTEPVREKLNQVPEQTLFPGLVIVLLALAGLFRAPWDRRLRVGLAVAAGVAAAFSLGTQFLGGRVTYRLLHDFAPGWEGLRTPARLNTFTSLLLALLAAGGAAWLAARLTRRAGALAACALCGLVLLDGSGFALGEQGRGAVGGPVAPTVPPPPAGQLGLAGPQLHLPVSTFRASAYMLWSTEGFPDIVNGTSGFRPRFLDRVERRVAGFPDASSVAYLRGLGVRYVLLHPDNVARTPWANWRQRDARRLGITRSRRRGIVVYELAP